MKRKAPRILFILHLPPPVHGAAMVGLFIQQSPEINKSFTSMYLNLSTSTSVDDIGKGGWKKAWKYLWLIVKAFRIPFSFQPDIIYMTITAKGIGFYKDALLVLFLKPFGKQFVFHFHNKGVSINQNKKIDNWLYRRVFKNAHVILLSELLYSDIEKFVPRARVHFCPNGIEAVNNKVNLKIKSKFEFLFIGNLAESKGILDVVDSLAQLKTKYSDFHCTVIGGEGAMSASELLAHIELQNLNEHITYVGKQYDSVKGEYITNADVILHPSHEECFPLVLLEAMSAGKPVVSTFEGGIPDIVENNVTGFLVNKKDISALCNRMEVLVSNPELRIEMGQKAQEKFLRSFTLSRFESKFISILNSISDEC